MGKERSGSGASREQVEGLVPGSTYAMKLTSTGAAGATMKQTVSGLVVGGRYRFLSPVWAKSDCEDLGNDRLRPVRLLNAAVTNDPNLKGILPLSNRNPAEPFDFSALGKIQKEKTMQF